MKATETAMGDIKTKVLHKNWNGYKVIETNGWIKVLYAGGQTRAKVPADQVKYIGELNLWIEENTR